MLEIIRIVKRIYIYTRTFFKLVSLITILTFVISFIVVLIYKPIYKVTLNGEKIGYCQDKEILQNRINNYMKNGDEGQEYVGFVQIDDMPEYKMCLQKKGITTSDDEIFETIKQTGITYYRYYAILDDGIEKVYLASFDDAESAIQTLKDKKSDNSSDLTIVEKYETEIPTFSTSEETVSKLYEHKVIQTVKYASSGSITLSSNRTLNYTKVDLGFKLIRPTSGVLTSRYGQRWGRTHTGVDIGAKTGTAINAAAGGTVTFAGWKGELGNLVVITHSNGVQTYYGHCSKIYVKAGQNVSAGDLIAAVGSTGRSTGPHLHFEIRINGASINPQSYIGY